MRNSQEVKRDKEKYFPILLLVVGALLTLQGIWGTPFEFFSGVKLAALFALGAMLGKTEEYNGNYLGRYMTMISSGVSLAIGCVLLTPLFWPGRAANLQWLAAYGITALFAWVYLMSKVKNRIKLCSTFGYFCFFPLALLASTLLAMYTYDGTLYAAALVCIYYLFMALFLIANGIKKADRLAMNWGFFLFWALITAFWISFLFVLPDPVTIGLALLVVLVFNVFFTTMGGIEIK